jgi:putative ABC transport system permease protein
MKTIDPDYMDLMGIELVGGRNFSWERKSDKRYTDFRKISTRFSVIINETAARSYWSESPVGKVCHVSSQNQAYAFEIIGIAKDVHYQSMHNEVEPMMYVWTGFSPGRMSVKIYPADMQSTIKTIEAEWRHVYGAEPFFYSFLDDEFGKQYSRDDRTAKIIGYFTVIAIIIACMGLFALSSFMAVRRTKEIGIRKVLGASSKTIFVMLSREYIKWILLSALIASPIAWYAMNKWLETFAYRIELGPWVFILAAVIALAIGLITVGWQALKSAVANPVKALRYE